MRIIDLETINQAMDNETQFVLRCEEVFHDKVSSAAAAILSAGRDRRIVALTGPSGSGKTTTAMRLREYLENLGVKVCLLSMDNFFLPLDQRPPEATDWESPYCVNVEQLVGCIGRLLDGEEADIPWYDFKTGTTGGAGICISASATRNGLSLIAVILGAPSSADRFDAATTLLDYGFGAYEAAPLPKLEAQPLQITVKGSAAGSVPLDYSALPETVLVEKGSGASLHTAALV